MGYSLDSYHVRGDLFKSSGKWMYTVQLDYSHCDYNSCNLEEEAKKALRLSTDRGTSGITIRKIPNDWFLVILEPYCKHSYPICVRGM